MFGCSDISVASPFQLDCLSLLMQKLLCIKIVSLHVILIHLHKRELRLLPCAHSIRMTLFNV